MDPLDLGTRGGKEWSEFRLTFAAAFMGVWLLDDMRFIYPEYFEELQQRLGEAVVTRNIWTDDPPEWVDEWDGYVPIQGPRGESSTFVPHEEAELLERQLFPRGGEAPDFWWYSRGLAAVSLHAALESYARPLGMDLRRKNLVQAIERYLEDAEPQRHLPSTIASSLRECDAVRNLFVHNRGVVDDNYINAVQDKPPR